MLQRIRCLYSYSLLYRKVLWKREKGKQIIEILIEEYYKKREHEALSNTYFILDK